MQVLLTSLLIFCLRVTDVSMGTVRVLYAMRGRRFVAMGLGFIESMIFILALSRVASFDSFWKMLAYAGGFATGNFMGITIERWIASGTILARIVVKHAVLIAGLREAGFGVTVTQGEGREGDVALLLVVAPRKRERELLGVIEKLDPEAFVTIDAVNHAQGGFLSFAPTPSTVRK
jgi:uncharacterized protein YebE (UPF0316 family)